MEKFLQNMLTLDRRWIYLVLGVALLLSVIYSKSLNPTIMPPAQNLFDAVEQAPVGPGDHKIIIVNTTFSAGSLGENGTQTRAIIRHLMLRHKQFAMLSFDPQGATIGPTIASDLAKQYGYHYGTDWIDFGYQLGTVAFYKSLINDLPSAITVDGQEHKPIANFPIMQGVKTIKDVAMEIEITASASVYDWITMVQPATHPRLKIGYGCTGVMATDAYTLLDSGQLVGMMPGLKGAADYEKLVDDLQEREYRLGHVKSASFNYEDPTVTLKLPLPARRLMYAQGVAHMVIIFFILLGNVGLLITRVMANRSGKENANG